MVDEQLDLLADAPVQRPIERVRAGLLNQSPTPCHASDPPTAWQASVLAALRAPTLRKRVLFCLCDLGEAGGTDYEVSERLGIQRTSSGKRRLELQRIGLVEDSGHRRPTDCNVAAVVWVATEDGHAVAQQLAESEAE